MHMIFIMQFLRILHQVYFILYYFHALEDFGLALLGFDDVAEVGAYGL